MRVSLPFDMEALPVSYGFDKSEDVPSSPEGYLPDRLDVPHPLSDLGLDQSHPQLHRMQRSPEPDRASPLPPHFQAHSLLQLHRR